jgi:hypothetical protein
MRAFRRTVAERDLVAGADRWDWPTMQIVRS